MNESAEHRAPQTTTPQKLILSTANRSAMAMVCVDECEDTAWSTVV